MKISVHVSSVLLKLVTRNNHFTICSNKDLLVKVVLFLTVYCGVAQICVTCLHREQNPGGQHHWQASNLLTRQKGAPVWCSQQKISGHHYRMLLAQLPQMISCLHKHTTYTLHMCNIKLLSTCLDKYSIYCSHVF